MCLGCSGDSSEFTKDRVLDEISSKTLPAACVFSSRTHDHRDLAALDKGWLSTCILTPPTAKKHMV